ncbi:MAG: hypothetical protein JSU92_14795 [Deltaproteobacteria bacterium]|nr:MAG: hypothetical protein JSU92_14795 [Deltaproteobacteria bacterium]
MKKNYKKTILIVFICLFMLLIGAVSGFHYGIKIGREIHKSLNGILALSWSGQLVMLQYNNADYEKGKEALQAHISLIEKIMEGDEKIGEHTREDMYLIDLGLSYARLALLAEKHENIGESKGYMSKAAEYFKTAGWKDYSESKIREVVNFFDSNIKQDGKEGD